MEDLPTKILSLCADMTDAELIRFMKTSPTYERICNEILYERRANLILNHAKRYESTAGEANLELQSTDPDRVFWIYYYPNKKYYIWDKLTYAGMKKGKTQIVKREEIGDLITDSITRKEARNILIRLYRLGYLK